MGKFARLGKVGLSCALAFVFTAVTLIPPLVRPAFASADADQPVPLSVPEDPLGQKPEQQIPEISVQTDIRDAHLVARVVDIWGPGRTPLVVRSYTNAESSSTSAASGWQFNQHLDILQVSSAGGSTGFSAREPDGNRTLYKYSTTRYDATRTNRWDVYVDDIGEYTTMELHSTCQDQCTWDGLYMVYLPKGATRRFAANGAGFGLIQEARDANDNVTRFAWTSLPGQVRAYIASVTDPVGRVTTYTYEQSIPQGSLWHYRVKIVTDPYGQTATYTYDTANHLTSSQNAAGRITTYGYNSRGLLSSITNPRGYTTTVDWSGGPGSSFRDDFNRPDSETIVAAGTSWVEIENLTGAIQIAGNALRLHGFEGDGASVNAEGVAYWNTQMTDQYSELQGSFGGDDREASVVAVRVGALRAPFLQNNGNNVGMGGGYGLAYHESAHVVQLVRYAETSGPAGGAVLATASLAPNHGVTRMRIEAIGSKIRGVVYSLNQPTISLEATDGTYITGFPAIGASTSLVAAGVVATGWRWDSWAGGVPAQVGAVMLTEGGVTNYTYNSATLTTTVTNALGHRTIYVANPAGDVISVTDPLGNATQFAYDARHNVTSVTDARGNLITFTYNSRNKITQIVQASGTLNLTTTLDWDGSDNLLSLTSPRGIRTEYTYDSRHNLMSIRRAVGTVDETLTQYAYTTWGGVASITDPRGNATTFVYTARHQVQTITPPAGGPTSFQYDAADNQQYMTDGNNHTWITGYDVDRLLGLIFPPFGGLIHYFYDANGNQTTTSDPNTNDTFFVYDTRDRLITIIDPLNGQTRYQYDAIGNLTKVTNARNAATNLAYDAANRLAQLTDARGQITTFGYDAVGNRTSMRDRKGTVHSYTYDAANRPTQVSAGGITVSYTYDAMDNRSTTTDPTGITRYTYDSLDRLTRTTYPDGKSVQFAYDKVSNRTGLTYPGGTVSLAYAYDAANRLTRVTQGTLQWTFGYDAAGNRTSLTQPNGTSTTYSYLPNNWLSAIQHKDARGSELQTFTYAYDANGNRITMNDPTGTAHFAYDALNRLIRAEYPRQCGVETLAYDAVGNRITQTTQQPQGQSCRNDETLYVYDANNRLTSAGGVTYNYDANGNLTSTSAGQTFTYDPFNRLAQTTGSGGTVTYTYNGDGLKVRRLGPDGATLYYYDGIRPIWETDSAGSLKSELDRDIFGNLLSRREGSVRFFYHSDGLGSMTLLTDEGGKTEATMLYDAWGLVRRDTGRNHGKYRYTAAELDEATGLYHMGARFYDPRLGRWLSEDPVQSFEPASLNFYAYVANNPLVLIDPTGTRVLEYEPGYGPGSSSGTTSRSTQEVVREWIAKFGVTKALEMLRKAWEALEQLQKELAKLGYSDLNLTLGSVLNLYGGRIITREGQTFWYAGVAIGTPGAQLTTSTSSVTPGVNVAVSVVVPAGSSKRFGTAWQIGTALACVAECAFVETGIGYPRQGWQVAVFLIW